MQRNNSRAHRKGGPGISKKRETMKNMLNTIGILAVGLLCIIAIAIYCQNAHLKARPAEIVYVADPNYVQNPYEAQERLKAQGYYNGEIDGRWGPETDRAYCDWCAVKAIKEAGG